MGKLISIWSFIRRRKYLITVVAFAVIIGFLDENSLVRRFGYERAFDIYPLLNDWSQAGSLCVRRISGTLQM